MGNAMTNVLCPLFSLAAALLELFHFPTEWIKFVKEMEYWAWFTSGTKDKIDKILNEVEEIVEELEGEE
jgi:hypothetical protein